MVEQSTIGFGYTVFKLLVVEMRKYPQEGRRLACVEEDHNDKRRSAHSYQANAVLVSAAAGPVYPRTTLAASSGVIFGPPPLGMLAS